MAEPEPIAIIGIGCRLPGNVGSPEDLWNLLSTGQSGWGRVPADRWNTDAFYHPDGTSIQSYNTKTGYFLKHDVREFDSRFFGFKQKEADAADPQQRILLETTYEALENAGIPLEQLKGSDTAVYTAVFARDYDRIQYKDINSLTKWHIGGTGEAILANRLSYIFDLKGASMTIDTGCSGSLVALHEACLALRTCQTRMAVVGGTEILLNPDQFISMSANGMLNPEGKCFTFDHRGAGYGRGEGVATVIVKRLADALEDGDHIHAVIRNTASNQDGKTNGITLPSSDSQEALMRGVYSTAGLDPRDTLYVEAHGTGTLAGDAAEIKSIGNVFSDRQRDRNLYVGSVKTNLGHTEATSGLAGLIKAILVLQKQKIPPNLNFEKPKPGLDLEKRQISIPLQLEPLITADHQGPVRASINSFGYGGTNCHVILERYERGSHINGHVVNGNSANGCSVNRGSVNGHAVNGDFMNGNAVNGDSSNGQLTNANLTNGNTISTKDESNNAPLMFPLSANSETALSVLSKLYEQYVISQTPSMSYTALKDLSYTLSCRRSQLKWRQACIASTPEELVTELHQLQQSSAGKSRAAPATNLAFVFTGQGAQWAGMGRDLLATSSVFKRSLERAAALLRSFECEWNLFEELAKPDSESRMNESALAQPVTTIIQMALVDLMAEYAVKPKWVVGHSSGEIAAAYAAGVLSDEDAIRAAFFRGKSSSVAKALNDMPGAMLAAGLGEQAARDLIEAANIEPSAGRVTIACVNSPSSTTLSGDEPGIDAIQAICSAKGVFARKLKVETAYHSHHMEKVAKSYLSSLAKISPRTVRDGMQFFSSVSGKVKTSDFGGEYWTQNLVSQVRFNDAVTELVKDMQGSAATRDAANVFVEIGPHSALQGPLRQILTTTTEFKSSYFAPLSRGKNASHTFATTIARLFEVGSPLKLRTQFDSATVNVLGNLPSYPWDHQVKHWLESRLSRDYRLRPFPYHDLLGLFDEHSSIEEPRWRHSLNLERLPWLRHHIVDGQVVFPMTGYTCMILEGLKQLVQMQNPGSNARIATYFAKDTRILRPIILAQDQNEAGTDVEVQLVLSRSKTSSDSPWHSVRILSLQQDGKWAEHVSTLVRVELQSDHTSTTSQTPTSFGDENTMIADEAFSALSRITALAENPLDIETMYAEHRLAGNDWGPSFALTTSAHIGPGVALAKLNNPDISQWMPHGYLQPHLIHPSTLDAASHLMATLFHKQVLNAPLMPVMTDELVFTDAIDATPGKEFVIAIEVTPLGNTAVKGNTYAFQRGDDGQLKCVMHSKGLQLQAIGEEVGGEGVQRTFERETNSQMIWRADPELLTDAALRVLMVDKNGKEQMAEYLRILTHKYPQMNVLEVGTGTGGAGRQFFEALGSNAGCLVKRYCATDVSSELLEKEKTLGEKWKGLLEYKVLDVAEDPMEQGFVEGEFDLIIASNLSQETTSVDEVLRKVRRLLKTGGRMLLVGESSISPVSQLGEQLVASGFGGIEFSAPGTALLVSKAVEFNPLNGSARDNSEVTISDSIPVPDSIRIVYRGTSLMAQHISNSLVPDFEAKAFSTQQSTWQSLIEEGATRNLNQEDTIFYVILDSATSPILIKPSEEEFRMIQSILTTGRFVLWITFQEEGSSSLDGTVIGKNPDMAAVKAMFGGLARTARRENEAIKLITLETKDLVNKDDTTSMDTLLTYISRIAALIHSPGTIEHTSSLRDSEFIISKSTCLIPRILPDLHFKTWADHTNHRNNMVQHPYTSPSLPLRLEVGTPGLLNTLHFVRNDHVLPSNPLAPGEIQIQSRAHGINFRDILIALGQMPPDKPMAGEVSGIVTAVGSSDFTQKTYKVGDAVFGLLGQAFASHTRLKGHHAHHVPSSMRGDGAGNTDAVNWADAASIDVVFATVYYSFVTLAHLSRGQTVLIHAATGAVGQAAIQYAQHVGAVIFATASSVEKRQTLVDNYGIAENHILNARAAPRDLKRKVLRMTNGKGVDVVLNSIAGEMLAESWDCIAPFGMHIELGKADISKRNHLSMAPFDRNVTFTSVDLLALCQQRPEIFYDIVDKTVELFDKGVFKPVKPVLTFGVDRLESAFRLIAERKHVGKVVLEVPENVQVLTKLPPPPRAKLESEGVYIIAGGLGDIGRRLIARLAELGAGHIVTLSRKTLEQSEHDALVAKTEAAGSKLHIVQCDITSTESVQSLVEYCKASLPPVRGIVHSGMVLRDHPLAEMQLDDWNTVLGPKVFGSWNLDHAFSSPDLDFFIMLSSSSGTAGNPGQGNYSAANNFQDSYARYHAPSFNTRYSSLSLPAVGGSYYIEEFLAAENARAFARMGSYIMPFEEVLQVIEYSMHKIGAEGVMEMPRTNHSVMGHDRELMSDANMWTPMFETLPRRAVDGKTGNDTNGAASKEDVEASLKGAKTIAEAVDIIAQATIEKFAVFLNIPIEDLSVHQAPASIGLDSLVSIELKNWITRAFKATLQVSELASAPTVLALASTLVMRSKFVSPELRGQQNSIEESNEVSGNASPQDGHATPIHGEVAANAQSLTPPKFPCCPIPSEPPRLPVPDLDVVMKKYLASSTHLATSTSELASFHTAIEKFTSPTSKARAVFDTIKHENLDPDSVTGGNWAYDYLLEHTFLTRREPNQYTSFTSLYHPSPSPGVSQAEKAALIATTTYSFKKEIDDGTLEAEYMLGNPVCMAFHQWLFNTARIPGVGRDETVKRQGDYCVVLRRGRAFVVELMRDGGEIVEFDVVRRAMDGILDFVGDDEGVDGGLLTTDDRDSWARMREDLVAMGPQNSGFFDTIDSAAFIVCLDDGNPETPAERAAHVRFGEGRNRWYDKGIQFVVSANGNAGVVFEHSYIDGTLPVPLHERIAAAIDAYVPVRKEINGTNGINGANGINGTNGTNGHHSAYPNPQELHLLLNSSATSHLLLLHEKWATFSSQRDFVFHAIPHLGSKLIASSNLPIKGIFDVLLQLTLYFYYNHTLPISWQPVSLTHFHLGRHDLVQLNSPAVSAFITSTDDETFSPSTRRNLMINAARDINTRVRESRDGQGHFRLFHVMDKKFPPAPDQDEDDDGSRDIYTHPIQRRMNDFTNITYINHEKFENVLIHTDPLALRLKYTIREESCVISTVCGRGKAGDVERAIERAVDVVMGLVKDGSINGV